MRRLEDWIASMTSLFEFIGTQGYRDSVRSPIRNFPETKPQAQFSRIRVKASDKEATCWLNLCLTQHKLVVGPGSARRQPMDGTRVEKFGLTELTNLRNELMETGLDSFLGAQVLSAFLTG